VEFASGGSLAIFVFISESKSDFHFRIINEKSINLKSVSKMSCNHKFINDLQLQYVDWEVKTLFIGTFNPEWNECQNNNAQWFYGRTQRNDFWCILPSIHGNESLIQGDRNLWIEFCRKNSIGITDIIESIDADIQNASHRNAVCNFKDDELPNFEITLNNIPLILERHKSIKQICITRQTLIDFWEDCFIDTLQYIDQHPQRNIKLKLLRSPSRGARKGVVGNFCEFVARRWREQGYTLNP
jgi:hypothetical protein